MQIQPADPNQQRGPETTDEAASESGGAAVASASLPGCAVVALSDDALLLEALVGAAGENGRVTSSPSMDRFVDQLVANGPGIALIDASSVAPSLKSFLITLREQFPQLVMLLVGSAQVQAQLAAQISDGTVFRFVHKPASSQRLRLFLDAALRQLAGPAASTSAPPPLTPAAHAAERPSSGSRARLLGGVGLAALTITAGAWLLSHRAERAPVPQQATAGAPSAAPVSAVAAPPAPAADVAAIPAAPLAQRHSPATTEAPAPEPNPASAQLAEALRQAHDRLTRGALIDPPEDSARTFVDAAVALAPRDPAVRAASMALGDALIAQARRALAAGDATAAERWLSACRDYRVSNSTLAQLTSQLQQLRSPPSAASVAPAPPAAPLPVAASTQAPPPEATPAAAAPAPAPVASTPTAAAPMSAAPATSAPAAATPAAAAPDADGIVREATLRRVTFVTPEYPRDALERHVGGWVDLEFTVTAKGRVTDVKVTGAEPRNTFERAARSALESSRYRPVLRDGVAVPQRARIRVRFEP